MIKRIIASAALLAAWTLTSAPASAFEITTGSVGIDVVLNVGSIATPKPSPTPLGAGTVKVGATVASGTSSYWITGSRRLIVNVNPGQSTTIPCAATVKLGWTNNFIGGLWTSRFFSGPSPWLDASLSSFFGTDQQTHVTRGGRATQEPGNTVMLHLDGTACIGFTFVVPSNTPSGTYYNSLQLNILRATGGAPGPTPTPSPTPTATPVPTPTPLPTATPTPVCTPRSLLYVSSDPSSGSSQLAAFDPTASGNAAPLFTLNPGNQSVSGVVSDALGNVYVGSQPFYTSSSPGSVQVFPCGATGGATPSTYLQSPALILPTSVGLDAKRNVYVKAGSLSGPYDIYEYPAGSPPSTLPILTVPLSGPHALSTLIAVSPNGTIYTADQSSVSTAPAYGVVNIYGPGSTTATATLGGPTDGIGIPWDVKLDGQGRIFVLGSASASTCPHQLTIFAAGSTGDAKPLAVIPLNASLCATRIWADSGGGVYVAYGGSGLIEYYPFGSTSPSRSLTTTSYPIVAIGM